MTTLAAAHRIADELVAFRRDLHRHPEVGLHLPRTQERILSALSSLPLEIALGERATSVVAVLRSTKGSVERRRAATGVPVVLLRADMDALPLDEEATVDYASVVPGVMHACGHDLHTTMLVGAARILAARADELDGDVVFMFQPGEEGHDGAALMIEEGVLDAAGRRADAAYAIHVMSALGDPRSVMIRPGALMAAGARLAVTVVGSGGHGSAPHLAQDPIQVAAAMVTELQTMITRRFDAFDPVILTVGLFRAGTQCNIIPSTAHFEATVRTFSDAQTRAAEAAVRQLLDGLARAHGMTVEIEYQNDFPATINDTEESARAERVIAELFGDDRLRILDKPVGASEDFSRILNEIPGAMVFLNAQDDDAADATFNHSPLASFSDAVLPDGAALYGQLARDKLRALARAATDD